jgi:phage terminase large subunit-like protein
LHKGLTALQVEKYFVDITLRDGKQTRVKIEQEPGASPKVLISNLSRAKGLGKGFSIRPDRVRDYGDKLTRSFDLQALAEDDKVRISSDIYDLVVDELVEFTGEEGGQDNITDVCTGSARHWKRKRAKPRAY